MTVARFPADCGAEHGPPGGGLSRTCCEAPAAFHCARKRATCGPMTGTKSSSESVHIVGAGLAGSEAAWQVAKSGARVVLHEMRPDRMTAAHRTDGLAELVSSNFFPSHDAANN